MAPVWVGETGIDADARGLRPAWTDYTLRYLREHDLDFAYWPIGDARPHIDANGTFIAGGDDYALLDRQYEELKYRPVYDTFADLL